MKLPRVYPLTKPSSHRTSRITAIVNSISRLLPLLQHGACPVLYVRAYVLHIGSAAMRKLGILLVLLVLVPSVPYAQMDTSLFAGLHWRSIGPSRGGRSQAGAGSVARPLEYYFGATGGGVWKTTDGGLSWRPVSDKTFRTSSVGALAVAASNPDIVYAGMGETELRGNIIQGDGVYKTTDAGKTWTAL